jgi:hypothetical protein
MYLRNLSAYQLTKAHEAADYLLSLPVRLDAELAIKLGAPRGALSYRPRSGHGLEEVSVGLMA